MKKSSYLASSLLHPSVKISFIFACISYIYQSSTTILHLSSSSLVGAVRSFVRVHQILVFLQYRIDFMAYSIYTVQVGTCFNRCKFLNLSPSFPAPPFKPHLCHATQWRPTLPLLLFVRYRCYCCFWQPRKSHGQLSNRGGQLAWPCSTRSFVCLESYILYNKNCGSR